ncbi:MAG: SUMF1/EgtB/PvdO family nonheme iron enzyme [Treponema sp.]|jgi:formylglycine-generating enzyme required for sulfatase activity/curli biogenesis system outer membrane secretion channel CsgG|nr:SUMF1/EgtB/PvdO family nonheme iron enzyme [Treponema sp.]
MKKRFTLCALFVLAAAAGFGQSAGSAIPLDQAVARAAQQLEAGLKPGTTAAVVSIASPTAAFSAFVLDEITAALVKTKRLVVIDRANLDAARQEQVLGASGEVDDESAQRIGHLLGAQSLIVGRLSKAGAVYRAVHRMTLQALNTETSAVEAAYTADIAADARAQALLAGAPDPAQAPPRERGEKALAPGPFGGVWSGTVVYSAGGQKFRDVYTIELYEDAECWITVRAEDGVFHLDGEFEKPVIARLPGLRWTSRYTLQNSSRRLHINISPTPDYSGVTALTLNKGRQISSLTRLMENAIQRTRRFKILDRGAIEDILREHDFQQDDLADSRKTVKMGELLGANYFMRPSVIPLAGTLYLEARIVDAKSVMLDAAELRIKADLSDAYEKLATFANELTDELGSAPTPPTARQPPPAAPAVKVPADMARIQGGIFTMGSPASEKDRGSDEAQHQVTLSPFYISKYEVTQKQWQEVMGTNPSSFKGDNLPVESVSWYDCIEYCNKRSDPNNQSTSDTVRWVVTWNRSANGYRLPTEAEWEYACRAGTTGPFNTGKDISTALANYDGNYPYNNAAKGQYRGKTTPVGSFAPSPWGLYDMHGNVWEWCWDWYGNYSSGAQTDPEGPTGPASSGSFRVLRGGGWYGHGRLLRSADRGHDFPGSRHYYLGFRLVRP